MRFITLSLMLGVLVSISGTAQPTSSDEALESVVKRSAATLMIRHNKARKALSNMSRDRVFESYFSNDGEAHKNLHTAVLGSRSRGMAKKLEAHTLTLVDARSNTIVKVVQGDIVDPEEAWPLQTPFAWTVSLRGQSKPPASPVYLSKQLDRWVVAHARMVTSGRGKNALLHAEFDLASLQDSLSRKSLPERIELLAVTQNGWVVFDSRTAISTQGSSNSDDPADYFDQFELNGMSIQELVRAKAKGEVLYADDGMHREIAVSKADSWYLVSIGTRIRLGAASE